MPKLNRPKITIVESARPSICSPNALIACSFLAASPSRKSVSRAAINNQNPATHFPCSTYRKAANANIPRDTVIAFGTHFSCLERDWLMGGIIAKSVARVLGGGHSRVLDCGSQLRRVTGLELNLTEVGKEKTERVSTRILRSDLCYSFVAAL